MRDGTVLRADHLPPPAAAGRYATLVYRTPYGKDNATRSYRTHLEAIRRNYAVVLQTARRCTRRMVCSIRIEQEAVMRRLRYDRMGCAAAWSNGRVGTYGRRIRAPCSGSPRWSVRLTSSTAMVPAMTFSVATPLLLRERRVRSLVAAVDLRQHRA